MATPQEIQRLQKLIQDLERAYDRLGQHNLFENFDINAVRDVNSEISRLENELLGVQNRLNNIDQSFEGIAVSLNDMLSRIKNSNNALNNTNAAFKGISQIVDKLSYDQQGITELNSKDLKSLQEKFKQRIADLKVSKTLLELKKQEYNQEKQQLKNLQLIAQTRANDTRLSLAERDQALEDYIEYENQIERVENKLTSINNAHREADGFLSQQDSHLQTISDRMDYRLKQEENLEKVLGLSGAAMQGMEKTLNKLGMGQLSSILGIDQARQEMEDLGKQIVADKEKENKLTDELNAKRRNLSDAQIRAGFGGRELKNLLAQRDALSQNNAQYEGMGGKMAVLKKGIKSMGESLIKNLKDPLVVVGFLADQLLDALMKTDQTTGELAKSMGISYDESLKMVDSMNNIANLSGETYITTENLVKSQIALSKAFGTNVQLSGELLKDYTQITEQAGYSAEAATTLGKITQATGGDLSKNTASILGAAVAFNATNKLALNEKEIVEEVAKTGAATVLTFGKSAKALANNVLEAKKFGLNLEQAAKISEGLLNFQSSIESELEAEVLTGKQLNFEQARFLALQGETGKAAAEVAKQVGGSVAFGKMNVIQQEALAKSVGLSRDELAQSILDREVLAKLGGKEKSAQDAYNKLKKEGLSDDAIAAKLGDEKLASQLKSQSVQERFNASIAKMQEIFVSIAEPILAIVSPLMDLVNIVLPAVNILLMPIVSIFKFLGESIAFFISGIKEAFSYLSFIGDLVSPIVEYFKELKTNNEGLFEVFNAIGGVLKYVVGMLGTALIIDKARLAITTLTNKEKLVGLASNVKELLFGKKSILSLIAKAAMTAFSSLASIPIVGPVLGITAAAGAAALGYRYLSKADDLMSPGYGKRTLMAPEGAIQLNDKDTIIAGTDLGGGGDKGGEKTTSPTITPSIDLSPLLAKMDQMNNILNQLLSKEGIVTLDGNKVGTALSMGSYKMQ